MHISIYICIEAHIEILKHIDMFAFKLRVMPLMKALNTEINRSPYS